MASSNKLRSSCSCLNLLLACLNFTLFILSSASLAPVILLRNPPTSTGAALLMVSAISLLSSFAGFFSLLTHCCFVTHLSLLLSSLAGQFLAIFVLFTRESSSLSMLKYQRDLKEAKVLVRVECGVLMAMFMIQILVLVLSCAVQSCWVREYEGMEAEREATEKKRSRKIARVLEESTVNATKMADLKVKKLDDKMNSRHDQWIKTDFEG